MVTPSVPNGSSPLEIPPLLCKRRPIGPHIHVLITSQTVDNPRPRIGRHEEISPRKRNEHKPLRIVVVGIIADVHIGRIVVTRGGQTEVGIVAGRDLVVTNSRGTGKDPLLILGPAIRPPQGAGSASPAVRRVHVPAVVLNAQIINPIGEIKIRFPIGNGDLGAAWPPSDNHRYRAH